MAKSMHDLITARDVSTAVGGDSLGGVWEGGFHPGGQLG